MANLERIYRDKSGNDYELSRTEYTAPVIAERVREMGQLISHDYRDKDLVMVGVLKGATTFASDLSRQINMRLGSLKLDYVGISSYNGTESSGKPRILKDIDIDITGSHVLIVEDIIDTGYSMDTLINIFKAKGAASLEVAAAFSKPERRVVDVPAKYIGFSIPNMFIVGYGLDYEEYHRELPDIMYVNFWND